MKKQTILIVDDQYVNRKILCRMLQDDYNILEAENGREALDILNKNKNTVLAVLLDIVMPVLDGYGVLRVMREDRNLSMIPVIVSSQMDGDEDEIRALSLGAQDFVAKPYKADIIRHRVKNTIRLRETAAIANKAEKDELTGLLSKQSFTEHVSSELHQEPDKKYNIICYDIERFKLVNDTYGTAIGDKLLIHTASVLNELPNAVFSSRFSADHFYQLVPRDDVVQNDMIKSAIDKIRSYPIELLLNANCGVYQIENINEDVIAMCDRAKLASDINSEKTDLYSMYDDSIRKRLIEEQFITGSMRAAIDEHQFKVYYQPKYDLHTEMIAGAEALVRWIHPIRGFMSPGDFIPLFEKNGFITQLDRYVWEQVCFDIRSWIDAGYPPVPISVNVSRADIFNPKLPEILLGLLKKYDIPIPYLHLEITESAYTDNPQQIIAMVGKLHDLGFVIEMDDFGSGYSSLNMLAELPVDVLKLDMRFVQNESNNSSGKGIMNFVISLAKWMKLVVVAEGVETSEQISSLRSMDCNFVQGYYYARPMPEPDFVRLTQTVAVNKIEKPHNSDILKQIGKAPKRIDGKTILVVDDVEINRDVLSSIFEGEYNVVCKNDGMDALQYLYGNYNNIEVVLLDLLMPVMDGFQLINKMKSDERLCNIPIVVTSQGDVNAEERALNFGADDFISKPYSPQVVMHRVQNVVGTHQQHNQQERALDETRLEEQTLIDSIPGGVAKYRLKKDGRIVTEYVSDGLAHLCGYEADEFLEYLRKDARINVVPDEVPHLISETRKCITEKLPIHELQHIYTKDKRAILVRFDANIITDTGLGADDTAVLYAVHTRVPEETERAVKEQNRYRYILDNLDLAYFELDSDGTFYKSDKYSLYALSDEPAKNILNNGGAYDSVHPEDLPSLFEFFRMKQRKLPRVSATLRLKMKDGSYRWTEMVGFFEFDRDGNLSKSIGVLHDVDKEWMNQNRKLQDALDNAENANMVRTEFLARISHEMRTPLNGIMGLLEVMKGRNCAGEIAGDLEQLGESSSYLLNLVNDMLDVSTIENGKMELHPTVCNGKSVMRNVMTMIMPEIEAKHIKFTQHSEKLPYTRLYIDAGRAEQAVLNILSNAVKFTPEGGSIDFSMENIGISDGVITDRITIRDSGIGMSPEFLQHVFEPFSQEHTGSSTAYGGTGLGMTITKQCVELMGGTVSVKSEKGKGTEFTIVLPLKIATDEQIKEWSGRNENSNYEILRGCRVLLCEDHPLNAAIAIKMHESKGVFVDHAENGKIGLDMFESSPAGYYDAVLMDIRMPVMDGLETTKCIRKLNRRDSLSIPIIAMTANALQQDVKNAINAGMTEHLGKPVEPKKLYSTLANSISEPTPLAGRKVLVVDDIEMNRILVKKSIENTYVVLEAGCGVEALQILEREKDIAALVTDIQMPQMDGKELIRHIRSDHRFDKLAILANTIYGDHHQEDELLMLGANDFVYKPTSPQIIMMRLEHILRNI